MGEAYVLGMDIGGTATRAVVLDLDGRRCGTGLAGGGNPTSHGPQAAASSLTTALSAALAGLAPARVAAAAVGLAGAGRLVADPQARAAFDTAWREAGLRCGYTVHGDAVAAYAAGTCEPDGTVLIAGTGAIAAAVRDLRLARVADGHGWLLGDEGSGFWLGRAAVRRALAVCDGRVPDGPLTRAVRKHLLGGHSNGSSPPGAAAAGGRWAATARETASALVQAVAAHPPVALAALAPLVMAACDEADPAAHDLVQEAADRLCRTVALVRGPDETTPVVIAGGLLTAATPLAAAVRERLASGWPAAPVRPAGDAAAAAAWLAARTLPGVDAPALHSRFLAAAPTG